MKTVRDACQLQDNALSIKVSDQIEQLDALIAAEGEGEAFFARTHITAGMQRLIGEGTAPLAALITHHSQPCRGVHLPTGQHATSYSAQQR
jgi:hypothetical protein